MFLCFQLSVAAHEFFLRPQPIFNVMAVLSTPRFVETVRELRNLIAGNSPSMPGVLPHADSTRKACPDTVVSLFHNFFLRVRLLALLRPVPKSRPLLRVG